MANTSILAAFARMWEHVITKLDNYATKEALNTVSSNIPVLEPINNEQIDTLFGGE